MVHLSNVHEDHHNQHENIHNMCNGKEHPLFKFEKNTKENGIKTWSEFPNRGKPTVNQILELKQINQSKKAIPWMSQ